MIFDRIQQRFEAGQKQIAVLIDPDKASAAHLIPLVAQARQSEVDYFFVGGSLLVKEEVDGVVKTIKDHCDIPVILFPGSPSQITGTADALLLLSLISGRNAELLIGQHVIAAPAIKRCGIEPIATGYMLIDGGRATTASYISNSRPIPSNKPEIAAVTAMAGEMLGMKMIYCDAGSGADNPVSPEMIAAVRKHISTPLIVGGGMRSTNDVSRAFNAGADIAVIGNAIEKNPSLLPELAAVKS